uniref:KHDC4/BBP-like KH-domain type I domain-containing protein n=1 Tax=Zooxanthella nutricula TaxID=1333877 RepID=A0A7S2I7B5_9DINO
MVGDARRQSSSGPWWGTVPVKNTFINYDMPVPPQAVLRRVATCPVLPGGASAPSAWERATQELCHAMRPMRQRAEGAAVGVVRAERTAGGPRLEQPGGPALVMVEDRRHQPPQPLPRRGGGCRPDDADSLSEVSTTSSERVQSATFPADAVVQKWTCVPTRKKGNNKILQPQPSPSGTPSTASPGSASAASERSVSGCTLGARGEAATPAAASSISQAAAAAATTPSASASAGSTQAPWQTRQQSWSKDSWAGSGGGKGEGKGKGLSHFRKIDVGIQDDPNFRVVQRLIGPKGKHMQDILSKARGAKIWIIGRGSRSWEDDVGPLVVCVGASSTYAFDTAVGHVQNLLTRVREDHRKFQTRAD